MFSLRTLVVAALAAPLALTEAAVVGRQAATEPMPAQDPFYMPPAGFESSSPGTVLKSRTFTPPLLSNIQEGYQLLYRTTAVNGSAIATVTTIFKPYNALLDRFVHFQTAYDSSATICDPSYDYSQSNQTDAITQFETSFIGDYLNDQYIVVSSDYEGPNAAFAPGRLEGKCVLDSMRAVKNFGSTLGLTTTNPAIVGAGYSGGAIATGWAASLQPTYAPELNIKGWSAGGTPANLTGTLLFIDGTGFSGFIPPAIVGLSDPTAYGAQLKSFIDSIATAEGKAALQYAATHCAVDDILNFMSKSILTTQFQSLGPALLYNPTIQDVLEQCTLGLEKSLTPTAPMLIYHAVQDEIIPFSNTSTLVNNWCGYGASINFTIFETGEHAGTELSGFPYAQSFVMDAFAGKVPTSGCTREYVGNATSSGLLKERAEEQRATLNIAAASDGRILSVKGPASA